MHRSTSFLITSLVLCVPALAQPVTSIVDNFESGASNWTHNDKNRLGLSDIVAAPHAGAPAIVPASKGAALVTFKSGKNEWASVSRAVDGKAWSALGAQTLKFWLNSGGDMPGVILQLRGKINGQDAAFSLPRPVRLDKQNWRQVAIPLSDFKGPHGEALSPRMSSVYLLQFQQVGTWNSRFFSLDDIQIQGTGRPLAPPAPVATPRPSALVAANGAVTVQVDFRKTSGQIHAGANVSIGAPFDARTQVVLESNPPFRSSINTLAPRWVRLDAGALVDINDSSAPTFSFARLLASVRRAQGLKAQVLIAIPNAPEWGLDERGYASLCVQAARALRPQNVRAWELDTSSGDLSDATSLGFYNAGYGALKSVSRAYFVGGAGANSGNTGAVASLLRGARGLDFLSVRFFGAGDGGDTSDAALIESARSVSDLKKAAGLLDKSRFSRSALFVSEANVAGIGAGGTTPDDPRMTAMIAGAWWGQFLASGSRLADQIFTSDATVPEEGLLDASSKAYPAYYATWMWNNFFPFNSTRVTPTTSNPAIFAVAANTPTSHNVLLVNTTSAPKNVQLGIRGFPVLRSVRLRLFDDPNERVKFQDDLPVSPFQSVRLAPYAIAVVQFVEPPKK